MQPLAVLQPRPLVLSPAPVGARTATPVTTPHGAAGALREWPFRVRTSIRTTGTVSNTSA